MEARRILVDVVRQFELDRLQVDRVVYCRVVVRSPISLLVNWLEERQNLLMGF